MGYEFAYTPDLAPDATFTFPVAITLVAGEIDTRQAKALVAGYGVYADAALTQKLPFELSLTSNLDGIVIGPPATGLRAQTPCMQSDGPQFFCELDDLGEHLASASFDDKPGTWDFAPSYYLAQYLSQSGQPLAKPKVTEFTIKGAVASPQATVVATLAQNGSIDATWQPVAGATGYRVFVVARPQSAASDPLDRFALFNCFAEADSGPCTHSSDAIGMRGWNSSEYFAVGQTTSTSVNLSTLIGEDDYLASAYTSDTQNIYLQYITHNVTPGTQDDLVMENELVKQGKIAKKGAQTSFAAHPPVFTVGVQAIFGDHAGPISEAAAPNPQVLPVAIAQYTLDNIAKQTHCKAQYAITTTCNLDAVPVTMLDGMTQYLVPVYQTTVEQGTDGAAAAVKVCAQTTELCVRRNFPGMSVAQVKTTVTTLNATFLSKSNGAGTAVVAKYQKGDVSACTVSKTQPTVPYPVNGSTSLVKFIAANIEAGNSCMDLSQFYAADPASNWMDAYWEAVHQNPMTLMGEIGVYDWDPLTNVLILSPQAEVGDQFVSGLTALRAQVWAKAQQVDAQIIRPGMTDRQKALAINAWVDQAGAYNYQAYACMKNSAKCGNKPYHEAYPHAWNAAGILLDGKGVCSSYSAAFKLLADMAKLKSVVVTGTANGESHAWDKAQLAGKWRVVDPTWDDGYGTKFFGLTDAQAKRTQDNNWMVDAFIPAYAAN